MAVVTDGFATGRFGSGPAAVGKIITLDGMPCAIVGVLRPGVNDLAGMRVPIWAVLQLPTPTRRGPFGYRGYARLKPGISLADASRDLIGISTRLYPIWQSSFKDKVAHFVPIDLRRTIIGDAYKQLELFAGAVALVLLVAIANVATLMLVRASARGHELAVRSSLGASRPRLARLVITECLVLTGLATVAGLGLAVLALRVVGRVAPGLPRTAEIGLDLPTVLVAIGIAVVSGLLISISPVAGVLGGTLTTWKGDLRRSGGSRGSNALRGVLVGVEFALAVPLLLAAALLGNSFLRLQQVDYVRGRRSSLAFW